MWGARSAALAERLFAPVETFFEEGFRLYADGSVVLTSALRNRALALGVAADRLVQIPHGADVDNLQPRDKGEARKRLGLTDRELLLGYVGNILPRDLSFLLEAFRMINHQEKRTRLLLIGRGIITEKDISEDIRDHVLLTGGIAYDQLQDYVAACDVMLPPLRDTLANRGRWPSKICDYLAAGRPVSACAVGDLINLFSRDEIGVLCRDDPRDFAEAKRHPYWPGRIWRNWVSMLGPLQKGNWPGTFSPIKWRPYIVLY